MVRILVIEDDDDVRNMVKEMLERQGHGVRTAQNGKVGLRMLKEQAAELVVTDIFMPEKEGIETIREVKRINPEVKIIAISGGIAGIDSSAALSMAKMIGADLTVPKPVAKVELLSAVGDLLSRSD